MANALEIATLRKNYRAFTLRDISFQVPEGYVMGLIGPNGAGKTTIIRLIMNLPRPGERAGELASWSGAGTSEACQVLLHIETEPQAQRFLRSDPAVA